MKTEIQDRKVLYKGFFTLEEATLRFEQFDGNMSRPVSRLNVYRGDASAVLVYHSLHKTIFFVKQFRYPIHTVDPENAWTLEAVAGAIEPGQTPGQCAVRETEEETGFLFTEADLHHAGVCWPSPGGTSERIHCYVADAAHTERPGQGGGLDHDAEDIQVVELDWDTVEGMVRNGGIYDAKTLICWYWFKNNIMEK